MNIASLRSLPGGLTLLALVLLAPLGSAHEVRPGYLEIRALEMPLYQVVWKQPVHTRNNRIVVLGLQPVFPAGCARVEGSTTANSRPDLLIESFQLSCPDGLAGGRVRIEGLEKTITDVLVRFTGADGDTRVLVLNADTTEYEFGGEGALLSAYLGLGIEHLLFGYDHILFVIGLILLISGWRRLVLTITGFTFAHSLTLGASIFGLITLPSAPVEACIALSVLFVAYELTRPVHRRSSIATRFPGTIAIAFGLLHGLGFSGVLANIGLPADDAIWALGLFNLGLEIGQLMVIAAVLATVAALKQFPRLWARVHRYQQLPAWVIGAFASWWVIERTAAILT